jgi:hypothetical protein
MGVLVLNAGYEPLHTVSVPHAIRMLVRDVAVVHEAVDGLAYGLFPRPKIVRLLRYVVMKWRYTQPPRWSRRGVLARDGHRCAYCGQRATTIDHVVPLSRGGRADRLAQQGRRVRRDGAQLQRPQGGQAARRGRDEAVTTGLRPGRGSATRNPRKIGGITPRVPSWDQLHPFGA